jgi:hypothetical protein
MIDIYCDDEDCEGTCRVVGVLNVKEDGKMRCLVQCNECMNVYTRKGFTSDLR